MSLINEAVYRADSSEERVIFAKISVGFPTFMCYLATKFMLVRTGFVDHFCGNSSLLLLQEYVLAGQAGISDILLKVT